MDDLYIPTRGKITQLEAAYPKELYKAPTHYDNCLVEDSGFGFQFWSKALGILCKDPTKIVRNSKYNALVQTDYLTLYKRLPAEEKEKLRKDYPTMTDILVREDISAIEDVSFILQSIFGR